ncbi:putative transcription factor C2H2 family [Helianthus annuus]|uniref:Putative zinc finger, RING/FYVE/PHD-type n=1 Tax=Helianthus annuus TaxID=4232 RepID=A0A251S5K3_HELAN|nr:probable E3 ubiquitin-protein ligase XBOS34 [Helianthus annuus]KAF5763156.1 putative transcription factor C2H2 family [Helianthus annuus]KAJ0471848.1 putative transcription factor C2H2 family [Helianthus annuus]
MEDDGGGGGGGRRSLRYEFSREPNGSTAGVTLGGILSIKETSSYRIQNRTLLDLIRNDPTSGNESNDSKKSWKMFREKLRLKLAGSVCTTTTPILASLVHINTDNNRTTTENDTNRLISQPLRNINGVPVPVTQTANSTNLLNSPSVTDTNTSSVPVTQPVNSTDRLNSPPVSNSGSVTVTRTVNSTNPLNSPPVSNTNTSSVPDTQTVNVRGEPPVEEYERTTTAEESRDGGDGGGAETVKMSLMSLLEVEGSAYFDEEEVAAGGGGGGGGEYNNCCVCMVRHKGAAFIPCGHTFCRLCSRELFVKRANCPLCNNFILEILDIF